MQRPAHRTDLDDATEGRRDRSVPPRPRVLRDEREVAHASPARDLQHRLEADMQPTGEADEIPGRWSARRSLAFAVGSSLALWGGLGWLAARMLG